MSKMRGSVGGAYAARGQLFMRATVAPGQRRAEHLSWAKSLDEAKARAESVQKLVNRLREAGQTNFVEKLVESAATADAEKLAALARAVDGIVAGHIVKRDTKPDNVLTYRKFAERWTGGQLHREYPDHVRDKRSADDDVSRLEAHAYPTIGDRELASITLDDALDVMRKLPAGLSSATRRHVAQLMSRTFALAVYPCRLLAASPLPRGFLPKLRRQKAKATLYADEEARLLACVDVPLADRMLIGYSTREGSRSSEALRLSWGDLDLMRGAVRLDKNKTDDPRSWALDPGAAEALRRWYEFLGRPAADTLVFGDVEDRGHLADALREHLRTAGVTRPELFEESSARRPIRFHDLRATFVTVALANGRSEAWVTSRTGHRSSTQVAGYRRLADTFAEVGAGALANMAEAIPEIAAANATADASEGPSASTAPSRNLAKVRGSRSRSVFRFRRRKTWGFKSLPVH